MGSLSEMASQIEGIEDPNEQWAAWKNLHAAAEAEAESAVYLAETAAETAAATEQQWEAEQLAKDEAAAHGEDVEPAPAPGEFGVEADGPRIREMLETGGRAVVTVRSLATKKHVTVLLYARKRKDGGKGFVSRATTAGRVGMGDADCVEARDPDRDYPDNYVGRFYTNDGEWRSGKEADPSRAWTAEKVMAYAVGGYPLRDQAEVYVSCECAMCGRPLTDPVSIERGIGPECYGKVTGSKAAPHA